MQKSARIKIFQLAFPFVKQEVVLGVKCWVSEGMALLYFFSVIHELHQ